MANYATVTKEDSAATENKNDEEAEAIYHQQNPCLAKFNKVLGVVTVFVVLTSLVICAIQGSHQHNDFLLLANILLSSFIAVVHVSIQSCKYIKYMCFLR
ncbi:hypothetical protein EB796_023685 [Bugula neritina]|uniref:Uncharacterized protein n=1 Tax=Bugula neritina TaxID=10212 RepID=A0A7J7IX73_BUGNE|nr:hypothetical protein EB796_023685 [Bugula neritina]